MSAPDTLRVRLNDMLVGHLHRDGNLVVWRPAPSWLGAVRRPILGQQFEEAPQRPRKSSGRLPSFFANLLPEGRLRERLAAGLGVPIEDDFALLAALGQDLPGAVIVEPADGPLAIEEDADAGIDEHEPDAAPLRLRFSVAGVQLKFSMSQTEKGWVLPAHGVGGEWLVKLSSGRFPALAENELATMTWAALAGLDVPERQLVPLEALDPKVRQEAGDEQFAYAIARYDRAGAQRIHQEDFAQVDGIYPHEEAKKFGGRYERLALLVSRICGVDEGLEIVRRLAFMVACGNGDAHWKNWSLLYPDGVRARLTPMYDFVCTIAYSPPLKRELAIKLGGARAFEGVTAEVIERMARQVGLPPEAARGAFEETLEAARRVWPEVAGLCPPFVRDALVQHWRRVPALRQAGTLEA